MTAGFFPRNSIQLRPKRVVVEAALAAVYKSVFFTKWPGKLDIRLYAQQAAELLRDSLTYGCLMRQPQI